MSGSIRTVGNWRAGMETSLRDALHVRMDTSGRTAARVCRDAIIMMAQSARALTPQSVKKRKVQKDSHGEYITTYKNGSASSLYKFRFLEQKATQIATWGHNRGILRGTWEQAQIIKSRGLAKRSWMWGLAGLRGSMDVSRAIPGVATLKKILSKNFGGFVLANRLSYLEKILPGGWRQIVEAKAINKIMKQGEMKLQKDWSRAHPNAAGDQFDMSKYIRAA
jgi:hypothetical protein